MGEIHESTCENPTLSWFWWEVIKSIESEMRGKMGVKYDYKLDRDTFPNEPENVVIAFKNLENRAGARIKIPLCMLSEINNYIVLRLQDPELDPVLSEWDWWQVYIADLNTKLDHIR